jgi:hypothetical protein
VGAGRVQRFPNNSIRRSLSTFKPRPFYTWRMIEKHQFMGTQDGPRAILNAVAKIKFSWNCSLSVIQQRASLTVPTVLSHAFDHTYACVRACVRACVKAGFETMSLTFNLGVIPCQHGSKWQLSGRLQQTAANLTKLLFMLLISKSRTYTDHLTIAPSFLALNWKNWLD